MREQIISRLAAERWNEIANRTNELVGSKVSKLWDELPQKEKVPKTGHIERILEAAGFFELLEAVIEYKEKCICMECYLVECRNCKKRLCEPDDNCSWKLCGSDDCPATKIDKAVTKAKGGA